MDHQENQPDKSGSPQQQPETPTGPPRPAGQEPRRALSVILEGLEDASSNSGASTSSGTPRPLPIVPHPEGDGMPSDRIAGRTTPEPIPERTTPPGATPRRILPRRVQASREAAMAAQAYRRTVGPNPTMARGDSDPSTYKYPGKVRPAPKKDDPKKGDPKKGDPKRGGPKKDDSKKDDSKKDDSKRKNQ